MDSALAGFGPSSVVRSPEELGDPSVRILVTSCDWRVDLGLWGGRKVVPYIWGSGGVVCESCSPPHCTTYRCHWA